MSDRQDATGASVRQIVGDLREIVIVVLGILIAFSLDAWWDGRSHRKDVEDALRSVRTEMAANADQIKGWIQVQVRARDAAGELATLLRSHQVGARFLIPDSLGSALWATPSFDPANGAVQALLASDAFGHIKSEELRVELASWTGHVRDAAEDEEHALALARSELLVTLGSSGDLGDAVEFAYPWARSQPVPARFHEGGINTTMSYRLLNFAILRRAYGQAAVDELGDVLEHTQLIMSLIEHELRG